MGFSKGVFAGHPPEGPCVALDRTAPLLSLAAIEPLRFQPEETCLMAVGETGLRLVMITSGRSFAAS